MDNTQLIEYRTHLLERMIAAVDEFCIACRHVKDLSQPIDEGWNVHQVAAHVRDVDIQAYGMRVRRTASENSPTFPKFEQNAWAVKNYRSDEPLDEILSTLQVSVQELVAWLKSQPESVWSRLSRHEINGPTTLQTWVERGLAHIEEHLETVNKATTKS